MKFKSFVHNDRKKKVKNEDGDNWFLIEGKRYYYTVALREKNNSCFIKSN